MSLDHIIIILVSKLDTIFQCVNNHILLLIIMVNMTVCSSLVKYYHGQYDSVSYMGQYDTLIMINHGQDDTVSFVWNPTHLCFYYFFDEVHPTIFFYFVITCLLLF